MDEILFPDFLISKFKIFPYPYFFSFRTETTNSGEGERIESGNRELRKQKEPMKTREFIQFIIDDCSEKN